MAETLRVPIFNCRHCGHDHAGVLFTQTKAGDYRGPCPCNYTRTVYLRWIPVAELLAEVEAA